MPGLGGGRDRARTCDLVVVSDALWPAELHAPSVIYLRVMNLPPGYLILSQRPRLQILSRSLAVARARTVIRLWRQGAITINRRTRRRTRGPGAECAWWSPARMGAERPPGLAVGRCVRYRRDQHRFTVDWIVHGRACPSAASATGAGVTDTSETTEGGTTS